MHIIRTTDELRQALSAQRHVALVPTMGNLHAGHLSLVRVARERGERVVTSIFVNRLQFAPHEDFATYPRTFERDCKLLAANGCDIVFAPAEADMYPQAQKYTVHPPPELADVLEGAVRPGFFVGVCTVVSKLFNIVRPEFAVFGKKDYQQLLVLRNMVRQFAFPIEMIAADTVRDSDGLALSSRNGYLNGSERVQARQLHQVLESVVDAAKSGRTDWQTLQSQAQDLLTAHGWRPDYVAVRRRSDLSDPSQGEPLVVLAAARLGGTRLIDNIEM
ncbi:MAG: pantoate--beta-alanine ligase [Pseudomonadota bacterium]|nr:pantoate--beta-alanine ligase [Pseudomonadota bacterium]